MSYTNESLFFSSVGHLEENFTVERPNVDNIASVQSDLKKNEVEERPSLQGQNLYTRTQSVEKEDANDYVYESFMS